MNKVEDLIQKKEKIHLGGGEDILQGQHLKGKLGARERINYLLDEGSFVEIDTFIKNSRVVCGYGTIGGALVYLYSEDYTKNGGSMNMASATKISHIMELSLKMGAPLIQLMDSVGGDLQEGLDILNAYCKILKYNSSLSGVVPQISVVLGPCTGMAAVSAAISDFTILAGQGTLYLSSPKDIMKEEKRFIEEENYGKAKIGSVQFKRDKEEEGLDLVKKLIEYFPANNLDNGHDNIESYKEFIIEELDNMANKNEVDIDKLLSLVLDDNTRIDMDADITEKVIVAMGKVNGMSLGVIAFKDELLEKKSIEKITKNIKLWNAFNVPMVFFTQGRGFEAMIKDENSLAFDVAKMTFALSEATVPKVSILIGEAYGAALGILANKNLGFDVVYAWPNCKVAITEGSKIIRSLYEEEIVSSENPKYKEEKLIKENIEKVTDIYKAAEAGLIDDILIPRETRAKVFMAMDMLRSKREIKHPRKHGSMFL